VKLRSRSCQIRSSQVRLAPFISRSGQSTSGKNQVSSKLIKCQVRADMVRYGQVKSRSGQGLVRSDHSQFRFCQG